MKTFFDHLGVASLEKIHSQTIAWIFSNDCNAYSAKQKTEMVKAIFDVEDFEVAQTITEYHDVDIVLESTQAKRIAIENKLKSSEHSKQLDKYAGEMPKASLYFLTLINEQASNGAWKNISYDKLADHLIVLKQPQNGDAFIVNEYINTVKTLVRVKNEFIAHPQGFPNVFADGAVKKADKFKQLINGTCKYAVGSSQRYIFENQLETIFQKLYYLEAKKWLGYSNLYLKETRGKYMIGKWFGEFTLDKTTYSYGFDFQGVSFKFYLDPREKGDNITNDQLNSFMDDLIANPQNSFLKKRYGTSKKKYIAISYPLPEGTKIQTTSAKQFANLFKKGVEEAQLTIAQSATFTTVIKNPA